MRCASVTFFVIHGTGSHHARSRPDCNVIVAERTADKDPMGSGPTGRRAMESTPAAPNSEIASAAIAAVPQMTMSSLGGRW